MEEIGSIVVMSASGEAFAATEHVLWDRDERDYLRDLDGSVLVFDHYEEAYDYASGDPAAEETNTREVEYSSYE